MRSRIPLLLLLYFSSAANAQQQIFLPDHTSWEFMKVIDGDTFQVHVPAMPNGLQIFSIRLRGIDAPELGKSAKCPEEQILALRAKEVTERFLKDHKFYLKNPRPDKYGNRILADIEGDGLSLAGFLLSLSLAHLYNGHGPRPNWCEF